MHTIRIDISDDLWRRVQARLGDEDIQPVLIRALQHYAAQPEVASGKLGGEARARSTTAADRKAIAQKAAAARWAKQKP